MQLKTMEQVKAWLVHVSDHANYCLDSKKLSAETLSSLFNADLFALTSNAAEWSVQDKEDGVYCNIVVMDNEHTRKREVMCFSRDGKPLSNLQSIEQAFQHPVPTGVYHSEATIENGSFEDASRFFNPNVKNQLDLKPNQSVKLCVFDRVHLAEFFAGKSIRSYKSRYMGLQSVFEEYYLSNYNIELIPQVVLPSFDAAWHYAHKTLDATPTLEGKIIRRLSAGWQRGLRNADTIKVVRYVYYKLRVTGMQVGKGKHSKAVGALMVVWATWGKEENPRIKIPVDGKISYNLRREWYIKHSQTGMLEGRVAYIRAKGLTSKGMLRQPKLMELLPVSTNQVADF